MKNKNTVDQYYQNVTAAAKTLEEYYGRMAKFTSCEDRKKFYNNFRREMRDLWKTHASYSLGQ
jgi:hypothetical protein